MTEAVMLGLVSGVLVLILVLGGLSRRRADRGRLLRLALIWVAIIATATLAVTVGRAL